MFTLVSDQTDDKNAIGIHKKRLFSLTTSFLNVQARHDSTDRDYVVYVEPNFNHLEELKVGPDRKDAPNTGLSESIELGTYISLDVIYDAVTALQDWYIEVLKRHGAKHRHLVEEGNNHLLVVSDTASADRHGEALIRARQLQAFDMMRHDLPLDHKSIVGRIMPVFLQALGLKHYHLDHDRSDDGHNAVKFIFDKVGMFAFYEPSSPHDPAFVERYTYAYGDYHRSFAGATTGHVIKKFVLEWLVDAARELQTLPREDVETYLDELATDIRRNWVERRATQNEAAALRNTGNVFQLSQFRHS